MQGTERACLERSRKEERVQRFGLVVGLVAVGLSLVYGGWRPRFETVEADSGRRLSEDEVMGLVNRFREIKEVILGPALDDTTIEWLKRSYSLCLRSAEITELSLPLLRSLFPGVSFYVVPHVYTTARRKSLIAVRESTVYKDVVYGFNRLLLDQGLEVNDKNILELARAFVVIALMDRYGRIPEITFLEGRRIRERISGVSYEAKLTVKINDQIEEWHFDMSYSQFGVISRGNNKGLIKQYDLPIFEKPPEKRGDLDLVPRINVATTPSSDAYVEWENDTTPHYYLIVATNGQATGYKVKFELSGFPPNARNVYLRVIDSIWAGVRLFTRVDI
ncbi:MAG: hypothetical protein ABIK44_05085 [candidate division WOR-3 bacterium]